MSAELDISRLMVPVPAGSSDVCPACRSWKHERFDYCSNCLEIQDTLSTLFSPIIPMSLYSRASPMRDWLKYYKTEHPLSEQFKERLRLLWSTFMAVQFDQLNSFLGGIDALVPVPSTVNQSQRALVDVARSHTSSSELIRDCLQWTGQPINHREPRRGVFVSTSSSRLGRVLVFDDVYTTGAHAHSAAASLASAGNTVVGILAISRRINPDFNEASQRVWDRQVKIPYSFAKALNWLGSSR